MGRALDGFVVDGVANNRAFLAAVMATARWRDGHLSTDFLAEEFPGGFPAVVPDSTLVSDLVRVAVAITVRERSRFAALAGRLNGEGKAWRREWAVMVAGRQFRAACDRIDETLAIAVDAGAARAVKSDWRPGEPVWSGSVDGDRILVQVRRRGGQLELSHGGATIKCEVMAPHVAAMAALMPEKRAGSSSRELRCPMPGVVRAVNVEVGQQVAAGQPLAIVEAMKMENVLRAERDATVARILAKPGDTLAVDAVILEFAEP
jgi:propionyl-CoA carboxylase alpha chain